MSVTINGHEYVTVSELANMFGVNPDIIHAWVRKGQITPFIYELSKETRNILVYCERMSKEDADSITGYHSMLFDVNTKKPEGKREAKKAKKMMDAIPERIKGCEYCTDDTTDILRGRIALLNNADLGIDVEVFITDECELELFCDYVDQTIIKAKTPIAYCPFCGRELRKAGDDE